MPPSGIPAPLPPWAKALLQLAPFISIGLQELLDYIGSMNDNTSTANSEWRHIMCIGHPTSSVNPKDRFVVTFDVVNITGGGIDNSWTQADYDAVAIPLNTLLGAWSGTMSTAARWDEVRLYRRSFNPLSNPKPFTKSGPPDYFYTLVQPGSGGNPQAPQVSVTHTERTTYPRHWGRAYWPWPAASSVGSAGHIGTVAQSALAQAVHDCYAAWQTAEFYPVVPVTQVDKVPTRGLLTVTSVQVDDVYDVIRRRRTAETSTRVVLPTA